MDPTILPLAVDNIVNQAGYLNSGVANDLREGKIFTALLIYTVREPGLHYYFYWET